MVTRESIEEQLKDIGVKYQGWGRTEMFELPNIILEDEKIFECVNGLYEGGFALLVATDIRVLLIDKKPMRYLNVEDLRFDMISEIDYTRRLLAAQISISTGSKNLTFVSMNQPRLRKLIGHVQHCMAENKKKQAEHSEDQKLHLEQINQQLQAYLLAQHQQQQKLQEYLAKGGDKTPSVDLEPVKPDPQLSDYLYAQSLLAEHQRNGGQTVPIAAASAEELYEEGVQEVFGNRQQQTQPQPQQQAQEAAAQETPAPAAHHFIPNIPGLEINPLSVAYSKLPLAMRNKKFGRPSFHAHSQQSSPMPQAE
ncbi:MAG TPA: PH domain-containing protein [Candidatus Saccharimonadales bacterium]|nr:PH domain-containing protein [Candidatus Saccharimonadales bacterium]